MKKISVVISAYNEERMIGECLKMAKNVADEIILVDNTSADKTIEIAKKYTDKIFIRPNDPVMLNKNKNFGFAKATGDWIISLDADERITPQLAQEIKTIVGLPSDLAFEASAKEAVSAKVGFEIPRKNMIFGKWIKHSIWWPDYNLRLFKKGFGKFPQQHVHEKLEVRGKVGRLKNPIIHYNYQTVSQFIKKLDRTYTESEVENFIKSGQNISWYDAIRWPANDFIKTFFFEKGYQDGLHGLVLSQFQAFYALVFFAKVWERKEKFRDLTPDNFFTQVLSEFSIVAKNFRHWIYQVLMDENPAKKLYYKLRRKLG